MFELPEETDDWGFYAHEILGDAHCLERLERIRELEAEEQLLWDKLNHRSFYEADEEDRILKRISDLQRRIENLKRCL